MKELLNLMKEEQKERKGCNHRDSQGCFTVEESMIKGEMKCNQCGKSFKFVDDRRQCKKTCNDMKSIIHTIKLLRKNIPSEILENLDFLLEIIDILPEYHDSTLTNFETELQSIENQLFNPRLLNPQFNFATNSFHLPSYYQCKGMN